MIATLTRRLALAAALVVAAWTGAAAQQPSAKHMQLAKEMLDRTGMARTFDAVPASIVQHFKQQVIGVTRPELKEPFEEVVQGLEAIIAPKRSEMMTLAAAVVAKQFTETDLVEILKFFDSPVGKKYVDGQNKLLDGVVDAMTSWGQLLEPELLDYIRAELKKRGHVL